MSDPPRIAVIGLACRFPGAGDVPRFWANLCDGVESISRFTAPQLLAAGHDPALVTHPRFVGAEGVLEGIEYFDAEFFGYSPRQAQVMDPQHRVCLELAWQLVHCAGYDPAAIDGAVGVYLGAGLSSYLVRNLLPNRELLGLVGGLGLLIHNDKDFLATTVSHQLGLRGPSMAVGTACSSSLVAVHLAVQSLLTFESDLAVAGGVSLQVPQPQGYVHAEDSVYSPDGHCRAFDAEAAGTVGGSGAGLVLLKRLDEALRDGDHVHAVLLGSAVNNDGAARLSYTAPGVDGQLAVITEAHEVAGIAAGEVGYVEAHGTGTRLGDPVEIEALTRAFRRTTDRRQFCAIGSVKTNIGHLDAAAGVASLIKAVLAVEHGMIPASLHYRRANPDIDFAASPFFVASATRPWTPGEPRTAGVSAFGMGGTNAHVVLRQAGDTDPRPAQRRTPYPFRRSRHWVDPPPPARPGFTELADRLRRHTAELTARQPVRGIDEHPGLRAGLDLLCRSLAGDYLAADPPTVLPAYRCFERYLRRLADSGPGEPSQELAARLTSEYPQFGGLVELLTHCALHYRHALSTQGAGLGVLYPDGRGELLRRTLGEATAEHLHTGHAVAAVVELARRLRPLRVLEVGAGGGRLTWELAEVLRGGDYLVTDVSRLFVEHLGGQAQTRGAAVRTAVLDISRAPAEQGFTERGFDLIVGLDVVHATPDVRATVANLGALLAPDGVLALIETTAADHWQSLIWGLSPDWWAFTDDLRTDQPLLAAPQWAAAVAGFARSAVLTLPAGAAEPDTALVLAQGAPAVAVASVAPGSVVSAVAGAGLGELPPRRADPGDWLYQPSWTRTGWLPAPATPAGGSCLVLADGPLGEAVAAQLRERGLHVAVARPDSGPGSRLDPGRSSRSAGEFTIDLSGPHGYRAVLEELAAQGHQPRFVVHAWAADGVLTAADLAGPLTLDNLQRRQLRGLHSLLFLAQAYGAQPARPLRLLVVTAGSQDVLGDDLRHPEQAMLAAAVKVMPREYPQLSCRLVDVTALPATQQLLVSRLADELLAEPGDTPDPVLAYRGAHRWRPAFTPLRGGIPLRGDTPLRGGPAGHAAVPRPGGTYLITGGLGGIGLALAEYLAALPATVVLTGRTPFPDRAQWPALLRTEPGGPHTAAIGRLQAACVGGGTVFTVCTDVTDLAAMRAVVDRFGPITGVVHAAGVTDTAGMIQRRTQADTDQAIAAKVAGTLVLDQVLDGQPLDFVVLCSSLGPILHGLKFGEVGYVAGNEFLDAFAVTRPGTIAISWTDWLQAGMWARARQRLQQYRLTGLSSAGSADTSADQTSAVQPADDLLRGITEAEGVQLLRRILGSDTGPRVVVSTQDLDALLAHHAAFTTSAHRELVQRLSLAPRHEPRPQPPQPPATAEEAAIAGMWQALLGVPAVGADDSFFALGGDSLLALRFLARLREEYGVDHPISRLFQAPTVREVAADLVVARGPGPAAGEEEVLL